MNWGEQSYVVIDNTANGFSTEKTSFWNNDFVKDVMNNIPGIIDIFKKPIPSAGPAGGGGGFNSTWVIGIGIGAVLLVLLVVAIKK